jgi:hypothetical protein
MCCSLDLDFRQGVDVVRGQCGNCARHHFEVDYEFCCTQDCSCHSPVAVEANAERRDCSKALKVYCGDSCC